MDGTVETFDVASFRARLLAQFTEAEDVAVRVTAASRMRLRRLDTVHVEATIILSSAADADAAEQTIEATTPQAMTASWFDNTVNVTEAPTATATNEMILAPSPPPPSPPPPSPPPFRCTLDFLRTGYGGRRVVGYDNHLVAEVTEIEGMANDAAIHDNYKGYWCALITMPELHCLDVGSPSTLSDMLNTSSFDLTNAAFSQGSFISNASAGVRLFGQYDTCDGKIVGDGVIDLFDMAVLVSYIFSQYPYSFPEEDARNEPMNVVTVEGRDGLTEQCRAGEARVDYLSAYASDTCVYFDTSEGERRLQSIDVIRQTWRTIQAPVVPSTLARVWMPPRSMVAAPSPQKTLAVAPHSLVTVYGGAAGRWYTLSTTSINLRLQAVFTGLPAQATTPLSNLMFDGQPPEDPSSMEVRVTRLCEYGKCNNDCAGIDTARAGDVAMVRDTLELAQHSIVRACPFEVHVWVPATDGVAACVGLRFLMVADGVRGQFARDTACVRDAPMPSLPPPSPRGPPPPAIPPPPSVGNASAPSAPSEEPGFLVWPVLGAAALAVCCLVVLVAVRRRARSMKRVSVRPVKVRPVRAPRTRRSAPPARGDARVPRTRLSAPPASGDGPRIALPTRGDVAKRRR